VKDTGRWTYLGLGAILGLCFLAGTFVAPRVGWAPPLIRIGVVNWEQVILQYDDYQQELENLQSKRKKILRFIEQEYGQITKNQMPGGSEGGSSESELEKLYQDALKQHEQRRQQSIEKYHQMIMEAIRQEAIEQGYSLILSENEVLYAAEGYTDLTNGVIERLNQNN
jgi:Skp family chaperone for outer membrane proteins